MTDAIRNQTDRRLDVPASVQREGEASAAMLAEVFQLIRDRRADTTPSAPSLLGGNPIEPSGEPQGDGNSTLRLGDIWSQMGIRNDSYLPRPTNNDSEVEGSNRREASERIIGNLTRGIRAQRDTRPEIQFDRQGNPNFFRDHFGEWTSTDGGNTWRIGDVRSESGPYHVRYGRVSMENGSLVFDNSAYGVRTTMADRMTTRSFTATTGHQYSITQNERGHTVSFRDQHGEWTREGEWHSNGINSWRHTGTGELREGRVSLGEHGAFRFEATRQGRVVERHDSSTNLLAELRTVQADLNRRFGITFAEPGDVRTDQQIRYVAGMPTLAELRTLESVLERSPHISFQGVRMWFAASGGEHHGHYTNSGQDHRCGGECQSRGNVSLTQGDMVITPRGRMHTEGMYSLEGTLLHELAHHEQGELFGQSDFNWGIGPMRTWRMQQQARELGWIFSTLSSREEDRNGINHDLPGRPLLIDNQGRYWSRNGTDREGNTRWTRVIGGNDRSGILVGGQLSGDRNDTITNDRMREIAAVRPATGYFIAPDEMQAEAFSAFRIDANRPGDNRRTLFLASRRLYDVIRDQDQSNIDRRLGTDRTTGLSLFVRDINGAVIRNTQEVRDRIRQAETSWNEDAAAKRREHEAESRQQRHGRHRQP